MKENKGNLTGRSMIEMLGVLAIIGVLSIGGLAAYRMAMEKNRANNIAQDVMLRAVAVSTMFDNLEINQNISIPDVPTPTNYLVTQKAISNDSFQVQISGNAITQNVCKKLLEMELPHTLSVKVNNVEYTDSTNICTSDNSTVSFVFAYDLSDTMTDIPDEPETNCSGSAPTPCHQCTGGSWQDSCTSLQTCNNGVCEDNCVMGSEVSGCYCDGTEIEIE